MKCMVERFLFLSPISLLHPEIFNFELETKISPVFLVRILRAQPSPTLMQDEILVSWTSKRGGASIKKCGPYSHDIGCGSYSLLIEITFGDSACVSLVEIQRTGTESMGHFSMMLNGNLEFL